MSNYGDFAPVYDLLTSDIDYKRRAEYFDNVILKHGGFHGILLDLGCGTGLELDEIFKRLYEDNLNGKITDERFEKLSKDYETEQKFLKEETLEDYSNIMEEQIC